jgi:hypothetical protein
VVARNCIHRRHFLLTFGASGRPPVAAVIIEAPSMLQARMTAVVRRLAPACRSATASGSPPWRRYRRSGSAGCYTVKPRCI